MRNSPVGSDGEQFVIPILFALMYFLPQELSVLVGGAAVIPYRVFLLALSPAAAYQLVGRRNLSGFDLAFLGIASLQAASFVYNYPGAQGVVSAGLAFLEVLGSYVVARRYLNTARAIDSFVRAWLLLALLFLPVLLLESALHQYLVKEFAAAITGGGAHPELGMGTHEGDIAHGERFGLLRAMGPFPHPILCGVAYAIFFVNVLIDFKGMKRVLYAAVLLTGVVITLSSNALVAIVVELLVCTGFLLVGRRPWHKPIQTIALVLFPGYFLLSLFASRPLSTIIMTTLALDSFSGYFRTLQWQYGWQDILAHPVFGIGYAHWDRPLWMVTESTDSYWLTLGVENGLLVFALIVTVVITLFLRVLALFVEHPNQTEELRKKCITWLSAFLALSLTAITVDYWNQMAMLVPMMCGIGVNLMQTLQKRVAVSDRPSVFLRGLRLVRAVRAA
jgi:hypothetical protein